MGKLSRRLKQANTYYREGDLNQAFEICYGILEEKPNHVDSLCLAALIAHKLRQSDIAMSFLEKAARIRPEQGDIFFQMGEVLAEKGAVEDSIPQYMEAIKRAPHQIPPYLKSAQICLDGGYHHKAVQLLNRALEYSPKNVQALSLLGKAYSLSHQREKVDHIFQNLLQHNPNQPHIVCDYAESLKNLQDTEAAVQLLQSLLTEHPKCDQAHGVLGKIYLYDQPDLLQSIQHFCEAIRLNPTHWDPHFHLAIALSEKKDYPRSIQHFGYAIQFNPKKAGAYKSLGLTYKKVGETLLAEKTFQQGASLNEGLGFRLLSALLLPPIYQSQAELKTWRDRMTRQLGILQQENRPLKCLMKEVGIANFYLAYQGSNDRSLQESIAAIYQRAWDTNKWQCSDNSSTYPFTKKIRVGFVSWHFHNSKHTIYKLFKGMLHHLHTNVFDTRAYTFPQRNTKNLDLDPGFSLSLLPKELDSACKRILEDHLDILVYPDIGMEPLTYYMGLYRLAPVQCVMWGHPVTTGLPNIDYFLSSQLIEPDHASEHYSEELIQFGTLPTYYIPPDITNLQHSRAYYDLPEEKNLYIVPQSLFKIHPDMDPIFQGILDSDPNGQLIFIEDKQGLHEHLKTRFQSNLSTEYEDRIQFIRRLSGHEYLNLLALSSVLLDPLHFGGGNTTYEGLAVGTPIVTLPGNYMRGRATLGCYKKMGVLDCVVNTPEAYIQKAVQLATDPDYRQTIKNRILETNSRIFEDTEFLEELASFFQQAFFKSQEEVRAET